MRIEVLEDNSMDLNAYAQIPMRFEVRRVFDIAEHHESPGRFTLTERNIDTPYVKDYDAVESPSQWGETFDVSNWCVLIACSDGLRIGGAVVAFDTPGLTMLEGRRDISVLWDIRVEPNMRQQGVGTRLFRAVESWAVAKGCRTLKVETQNINVPACRFYERQGCRLGSTHRFAYPDFPNEVQMLWYKDLAGS